MKKDKQQKLPQKEVLCQICGKSNKECPHDFDPVSGETRIFFPEGTIVFK